MGLSFITLKKDNKMNRIRSAVVFGLCAYACVIVYLFDGLSLEHDAAYGLIIRGIVWLTFAGLAALGYENLKSTLKLAA